MPRYSATIAISSARRRRWPLRRSVTAEGERPSALARPLRVLPVLLRPARIQSTVKAEAPNFLLPRCEGVGRARFPPRVPAPEGLPTHGIIPFSEKPQFKKTET